MQPLEYMKKELALMVGEYDQHLADCALAIAAEFDKEGHSGHSISWFANQFRIHTSHAIKTCALGDSSWREYFTEHGVELGTGELAELATEQFFSRVDVLDKFEIRALNELETILKLVTLYTKMTPIRRIDLKNRDNYVLKHGYHYHVDDFRFHYDKDGQLWLSDLGVFSDNGGRGWFTSKHTQGKIDTDFDPIFKRYYVLVDADERNPIKGTRLTTPGAIVRNVHGEAFKISGIVPHPDTTQPYFKLEALIRGEIDPSVEPLIVSSNSLINGTLYVKELDITIPLYQQWPVDLEQQ